MLFRSRIWVPFVLLVCCVEATVLYLLGQIGLLPPVFPLPLPHLLTELVHTVRGGVVHQGQEVSVPHLLIGRLTHGGQVLDGGGGGGGLLVTVEQLVQALGVDDLQGDLEQTLMTTTSA